MKEKEDNETLQEYTIQDIIGSGTFSVVRSGINKKTKEKVAIKILDKSKITDQKDYIKIVREINMLKSLNHPNVIKIHKTFENANYIYIIMELCENGELFDYIVKKKYLSEEEAAFFYYQLINGLGHIHKNNIIHRDLKPENLLLSSNNTLKIIDFGLRNYFRNNLLTTPCGSPCYASPEMISGKKYNGFLIDIWSTGIILYAMVCGHLPFEDKSFAILFQKILNCKISFHKYVGELSKDLIKKILVQNPEKRITLEQIKKHEFYLKGKEIFYKKHPELIENKIICENKHCIKIPTDSSKKNDKHYNRATVIKIKNIEHVSNIEQPQSYNYSYNYHTISISKNKSDIINNISKEENKESKNTTKFILNPIPNEINKSEPADSKRNPKDNEKLNSIRNKINTSRFYSPDIKISSIMNYKEKVDENLKKLNLEFKNLILGKKIFNTENNINNKKNNQNQTVTLEKYAKCVKISPQSSKNIPKTTMNSEINLESNSNSIIKPKNNIIMEKLTNNLNMNNYNKNKTKRSESVGLDNEKFNSKNIKNFQKKLFSSKFVNYSEKDIDNNSFKNTSIENNFPRLHKTARNSNIIINNNNNVNFNNSKLYIYIENNSDKQNNSLKSTKYIHNLIKNNLLSLENRNDDKLKCRNTSKSVHINKIRSTNSAFRFIDSSRNNSLNYNQVNLVLPKDYNYQINRLTNLQRFNTSYKICKKSINQQSFFNSNIKSNFTDPSKEVVFKDVNEFGNYNLSDNLINENKNIPNSVYNIHFAENGLNYRMNLVENVENEKNKPFNKLYNNNANYMNQIDSRSMRNTTVVNVIDPTLMNYFSYNG